MATCGKTSLNCDITSRRQQIVRNSLDQKQKGVRVKNLCNRRNLLGWGQGEGHRISPVLRNHLFHSSTCFAQSFIHSTIFQRLYGIQASLRQSPLSSLHMPGEDTVMKQMVHLSSVSSRTRRSQNQV